MALNWNWNGKIGELLVVQDDREFVMNVYQGNALAIFLHEWKNDEGVELYEMYQFFVDKDHFKNCAKDKEWDYARDWKKLSLTKVPNDFWIILKDLVKRGVEIEIKGTK